jgi:hypothetical protein
MQDLLIHLLVIAPIIQKIYANKKFTQQNKLYVLASIFP